MKSNLVATFVALSGRGLKLGLVLSLTPVWPGAAWTQVQFNWPVTPFQQTQEITGNFAEYRSTTPNGHFHNGTDIPKPDGSPVYPVKDGVITSLSAVGSAAFVRVQDVAYVHISPNPALAIGDSVFASQTVLGVILSGMGHVHFTNGFVGSEKNSLLPGSGLTPYDDPWPPIIRFVQFYQNNTTNQIAADKLSGLVDIVVKVDEQNGPPGARTSRLNNGTYKIGFKILSADTSSVLVQPPNNGVRFQFDTKPSNSLVNIVFFQKLSSTTSHVYQVTNEVNRDNFWNTAALPKGDYVVMAFTEDTRGNADTAYVAVTTTESDFQAPAQPDFAFIREIPGGMRLNWLANSEPDLAGYRLDFSFDNKSWSLFRDEKTLGAALADTTILQVLNRDVYFRLAAVDDAPLSNESPESDVFGMSNGSAFIRKVLVVNGFDRRDGGWTQPGHFFVFTHGQALVANQFSFDSAANEAVENGDVRLRDYEAVFWLLGDEFSVNETFSVTEQDSLRAYLQSGGFLFVSGSEIASDLDPDAGFGATPTDEIFLHDVLQVDYVAHQAESVKVSGVTGSIFDGLAFSFGQIPYPVQTPDVIAPFAANALRCLEYDSGNVAAVQFEGAFGQTGEPGKLVYLAFPFETVATEAVRNELFKRALNFFFGVTSVAGGGDVPEPLPGDFSLRQNYPNPFNPETKIGFTLNARAPTRTRVRIFNIQGQEVATLLDAPRKTGDYEITWNGRDRRGRPAPSGVYLYEVRVGEKTKSGKMLLLR